MTTTTLTTTSTLNLSAYSNVYTEAREGAGAVLGEWPWVGQYRGGGQFDVTQVAMAFSTATLTGSFVKATLSLTVEESYGNTTVEVREHDWPASASAFVPGTGLTSKPLVGSVQVGPGGRRDVSITLSAFDLKKPFKILLVISDQTNGVAPTGDTTLLVTAARLEITTAPSRRLNRTFRWL